jgi:LAO/AO transport system kinase
MASPDLAGRLLARERAAVPEALNLIDDQRPASRDAAFALVDRLEREVGDGGALRVGVTGPPGAGKSTLLDALLRSLRAREESVGVIAVDPSSQKSGGALLGDRIRMRAGARDPGVFVRSMAARRRLGGVADATYPGVQVLCAVFDWVFVETVGVGQSESDAAHLVDSLVLVVQPGAGDLLQFMKAGIVELPDLFVVNKADLGAAAERTAAELRAGLGLGQGDPGGWSPPVLLVSARDGGGVEGILAAIADHRRHLETSGALKERRRSGRIAVAHEVLLRRYGSFGVERLGGPEVLEAQLQRDSGSSAMGLVQAVGREIEAALAGRRA